MVQGLLVLVLLDSSRALLALFFFFFFFELEVYCLLARSYKTSYDTCLRNSRSVYKRCTFKEVDVNESNCPTGVAV